VKKIGKMWLDDWWRKEAFGYSMKISMAAMQIVTNSHYHTDPIRRIMLLSYLLGTSLSRESRKPASGHSRLWPWAVYPFAYLIIKKGNKYVQEERFYHVKTRGTTNSR